MILINYYFFEQNYTKLRKTMEYYIKNASLLFSLSLRLKFDNVSFREQTRYRLANIIISRNSKVLEI